MMKKAQTFILFLTTLVVIIIGPTSVFAGFGVSPPLISEDNLVPGSSFEREISLVQGNSQEDVEVEVRIESRDIKDWISVRQGDSFVIPAGVQQYPIKVRIDVPENAELGEYSAVVWVTTVPDKPTQGGSVAVALGGKIDVEITVGDNVISEYTISSIDILDVAVGASAQARLDITNTGNVGAGPTSASFELFDKYGDIRLAFGDVDITQTVPAFKRESIDVEFPLDIKLAEGEYWAHVRVYDDQELVGQNRTVFNVGRGGGFGDAVGIVAGSFLSLGEGNSAIFIGGGVLILILLVAIITLSLRLKRHKRTR